MLEKINYAADCAYVRSAYACNAVKEKAKKEVDRFVHEERGAADFIAIILIIVVVVALVVVFRKNIAKLINNLWDKIFKDAEEATSDSGADWNTTSFT